ncbi:MAG: hypothetical protein K1X35_02665 [Caulobacteraceae bacterium]|nr:hypothetical protein [Caulobacteraceae bacterium]
MKSLRVLACVAAIVAAGPAAAAEQVFHADDGPEILSTFDGKPLWQLQAMCAGFHGATANYYARVGETAKAKASEAAGLAALNDAVDKIEHDRNVTEKEAMQTANQVVTVGGRAVAEMLRIEGTAPTGRWNYWRSFCIDARDTFHRVSH